MRMFSWNRTILAPISLSCELKNKPCKRANLPAWAQSIISKACFFSSKQRYSSSNSAIILAVKEKTNCNQLLVIGICIYIYISCQYVEIKGVYVIAHEDSLSDTPEICDHHGARAAPIRV